MKIAIISDIHSNLEALTACYRTAEDEGAEKYVCLGDTVGYGPDPVAVLDILQSLPNLICVLGNHDEYMFNCTDDSAIPPVKEVAEWTAKQLTEAHLDFLKSLSYVEVDNGVSYGHADLVYPSNWTYITRAIQALHCMDAAETNLVFYGHVHIPIIFHEKPDNSIELLHPQDGVKMNLNQNQRYIINTGSVGQPRDNDPRSCYVIVRDNHIEFRRVDYPIGETRDKIFEIPELDNFLGDRLLEGR